MFQPLDPLLHAELRLAVMSLLISADEAEFPYIKEQTGATAGNLSVQIDKLSTAGYIEIEKTFKGKRPERTALPATLVPTLYHGRDKWLWHNVGYPKTVIRPLGVLFHDCLQSFVFYKASLACFLIRNSSLLLIKNHTKSTLPKEQDPSKS